jgi:hypothetical protein
MGVCLHMLDLVIRDWLEPSPSLESPEPKQTVVKQRMEFFFFCMCIFVVEKSCGCVERIGVCEQVVELDWIQKGGNVGDKRRPGGSL